MIKFTLLLFIAILIAINTSAALEQDTVKMISILTTNVLLFVISWIIIVMQVYIEK